MRSRFYFLLLFYTLMLLFYPGDVPLFSAVVHNNDVFDKQVTLRVPELKPVPVVNAAPPSITAQGAYIVDLETFTPVFGRNERDRFFPASTTKIVTALVAEDLFKEDEVVTIKRVVNEGQIMGLVRGERITVENLLYGILVHSGNDAAYALADHYGYDEFMTLMNAKAKELGMENSQFKNPAGLDAEGQYSSPFDLAVAGRQALRNKTLRKMVGTKEITIADEDFKYFHRLSNVNQLLGEIQGVGGLKTGYTEAAGQNLVSFYKRPDGRQFVIVVLNSEDRFEDTRTIIDWIRNNVRYVDLAIT
jgi:D-alanyl-D-alanine carboxypeptidase